MKGLTQQHRQQGSSDRIDYANICLGGKTSLSPNLCYPPPESLNARQLRPLLDTINLGSRDMTALAGGMFFLPAVESV